MKSPQKVVNQIRDCLIGNPDPALLRTLASEYAEYTKIANSRLEQCSIILSSGDEYQTLQMAEVHPPLLDLVAILSFQEYAEWKRLCQEKGLHVPERLHEKSIASLNALYHKGLSSTHPYYKAYRSAMFEKNEEKALHVLFTISRLNSTDAVAKSDLERLQKRVLDKKLPLLRPALASGNQQEIARIADEVERIDPKHECHDPSLEQAREILAEWQKQQATQECRKLLEQLRENFSSGHLDGIKPMAESFTTKKTLYQVTLSEPEETEIADMNSWYGKLLKVIASQETEEAAQSQLKKWLDENEPLLATLPSLPKKQLLEFLSEAREAMGKSVAPTPHLKTRIQSFIKTFDQEMQERSKKLRKKLFSLTLTACVIILAAGWGYWKYATKQHSLSLLAIYKKDQRVADSLKILSKLGKPTFFNNPFLSAEDIAPYEAWTRETKGQGDQALYLAGQFALSANHKFSDKPLAEQMGLYKQLSDFAQTLPQEYSTSISDILRTHDAAWQAYLQSEKLKFDKTFNDLLLKTEGLASSKFNFTFSPEKIREAIPELQRYEQQLGALLGSSSVKDSISTASAERLQSLRVKIASFKLEVENYDTAIAKLKNSLQEKTFFDAIRLLADSKLVSTMEVRAAREFSINHLHTASNLAQNILMPDDPEGWKSVSANLKNLRALPSDATPDEISAFVNLRDNQELRNIWKYEIRSYSKKKTYEQPDETRTIYSLGALSKPREKTDLSRGDQYDVIYEWTGQFYDPKTYPDSTTFVKRSFNGSRNKKQNIAIGEFLENGAMTPESQMFLKLGLDDFYSGENKNFKLPILSILDRLRSAQDAAPMFKTQVHLAIAAVCDYRPNEWGLHLTPAAVQHIKMLQEILKPLPAMGDWLVPRKKTQFESKLNQFYSQTSQTSYEIQFKLHAALFQEVMQSGFIFAGYVGADGTPVLLPEGIASREVWGINKSGKISLLMKAEDNKTSPKLVQEAVPFSPLYAAKADRFLMKKKAFDALGLALRDKNYEDYLPVYFRDTP